MITNVERKTFKIRPSGRSSDYITPSFGYGCLFKCSYCYMKRHLKEGLSIATNTEDILGHIYEHAKDLGDKIPNQTSKEFWTYDISCNEDFALHSKYHNTKMIFDFFTYSDLPIMGTMATKYVNPDLINYNVQDINENSRIRIRFSLMPQKLSNVLEPNTSKIIDRIKAIDAFIDAGYDVDINYSPVIVYKEWLEDYKYLFEMVNDYVDYKNEVQAEVIFLTHNEQKHIDNLQNNLPREDLLWNPKIQESKVSQYGGDNVRYKYNYKRKWITQFKNLHNQIIPWNTIRYIF